MNRVLLKTHHFLILISQTKTIVGLKTQSWFHKNMEIFKGSGKKTTTKTTTNKKNSPRRVNAEGY